MNGPEHYIEAERLIDESKMLGNGSRDFPDDPAVKANRLAQAQVHATLALVAITADGHFDPEGRALLAKSDATNQWEEIL